MSRFRVFKAYNRTEPNRLAWRRRLGPSALQQLEQKGRTGAVLRALAQEPCLKIKEVLESFEVHACIKRRLPYPRIIDLCCGHGLTGMLFAIFNPNVTEVLLLDVQESDNSRVARRLLEEAFPEIKGRIRRLVLSLEDFTVELSRETALIAVHACGSQTDRCLDLAIQHQRPIAAVPCCYTGTGKDAPYALRKALGGPMATDIGRTYRLEEQGFVVEWDTIPDLITPKNRVILAHPDGASPSFQRKKRQD